ncbi:hypothetical protein VNO78_04285 [Psophocarpus tetragonolobus]|uniref:Uncharacterized protein n=1 Tax=Psophocarpus tetragonolobus TaxID=3891 RepID=A0AAN9T5N2_PSOTE
MKVYLDKFLALDTKGAGAFQIGNGEVAVRNRTRIDQWQSDVPVPVPRWRYMKPFKGVILLSIHVAASYWLKVKFIGRKSNPTVLFTLRMCAVHFLSGDSPPPLNFSPTKLCRFTANPLLSFLCMHEEYTSIIVWQRRKCMRGTCKGAPVTRVRLGPPFSFGFWRLMMPIDEGPHLKHRPISFVAFPLSIYSKLPNVHFKFCFMLCLAKANLTVTNLKFWYPNNCIDKLSHFDHTHHNHSFSLP